MKIAQAGDPKPESSPLGIIATFLSFVSILEVPLSFASGDYFFESLWIDLAMSSLLGLHFWRSRKERSLPYKLAFAGSLPYELVISVLPFPYMGALRILRLLRFASCYHILQWSGYRYKALQVGAVSMALALVSHWIACGWMITHHFESGNFAENYMSSLYWAVMTLTTVGYGDIVPNGVADRLFSMLAMLMGVGVFGMVIGQFSSLIIQADRYKQEKSQRMNNLIDFLERYEVSHQVGHQVIQFYRHYVEKNIAEHDGKILADLPESLQHELKLFMKIKFIRKLAIFRDLSHECLRSIALSLKQEFYTPGQYIVKNGDEGEEMFIISHGEVEVSREGQYLVSLKNGQVFGEIALLEKTTRNADVISQSYSDLYLLKREDYFAIAERFPELDQRMQTIYEKRTMKASA